MSPGRPHNVVVVGASAAGLSTAEALRRGGYQNKLTVIGAETHLPYDRPPLSKQFLTGDWDADKLMLRSPDHFSDLEVESRLGVPAAALDTKENRLVLADGAEVGYDRLVVATGVSARILPDTDHLQGVHYLRTLDDAVALRDEIGPGQRVIIVGAGFLGTEVAAVAVSAGADVTLLCKSAAPLDAVIGTDIGCQLADLHTSRGVKVKTGAAVAHVLDYGGRAGGVALASGEVVLSDVVVVAIGSVPAVDWLHGSGLNLADGVVCAPDSAAAPGIYAVGDVSRWHNHLFDVSMRLEHRTNAVEQGIHVAEQIVSGTRWDYTPVPYFWSDQYDVKLQSYGVLRDHDEVLITEGCVQEGKFVALFRRQGRLSGVLAARSVKSLRKWRELICDGISWKEALDAS